MDRIIDIVNERLKIECQDEIGLGPMMEIICDVIEKRIKDASEA